jgi:RNA polymerase sigma factor (sigma-70 family)
VAGNAALKLQPGLYLAENHLHQADHARRKIICHRSGGFGHYSANMNSEPVIAADSELVICCLQGDRDAFRSLVERYQSLVSSVAYAGCGDLHLSEEIAQETFLTAWHKLRDLHDPEKCKSWLCGITRNLTQNAIRRRRHAVTAGAEVLDENAHSPEISPREHAVSREEEAMLWSALDHLPENYREPMILYYRESESVAAVAAALDISEDAVKQRLSRGRVILTGNIERSLRSALRTSAPGQLFTLGVLTAISAVSASAKAASLGNVAAKGATAKSAVAAGIFGALLGPVLMLVGNYAGYRISMETACTASERSHIKRLYLWIWAIASLFFAADALILWANRHAQGHRASIAGAFIATGLAFTASAAWLMVSSFRERKRLVAERIAAGIPLETSSPAWEYRSAFQLLGIPFIHLRFGNNFGWRENPVKAWIAAGDRAFGLLFAFGGIAVAPVCFGGFAIGFICWGGFAAGLFALGGFSLGWWAVGGVAFGWKAFAGCAVAWRGAMGGVAIARDFASGGFAYAAQANNRIARHWLYARAFFRDTDFAGDHMQWLNLLWVLPLLQWWRFVKKHRNEPQPGQVR